MEWRGRILIKSSVRIQATYYETYILLAREHVDINGDVSNYVYRNVSFNVSTKRVNYVYQ